MKTHIERSKAAEARPYTYLKMNDGRWYGTRLTVQADQSEKHLIERSPRPVRQIFLDGEPDPVVVFPLNKPVSAELAAAAHLTMDSWNEMNQQIAERKSWNTLRKQLGDYVYYVAGKPNPALLSNQNGTVSIIHKGETYIVHPTQFDVIGNVLHCQVKMHPTGSYMCVGTPLEIAERISKLQDGDGNALGT